MVELAKDSIDLGIIVEDAGAALKFYMGTLGLGYDAIGAMDMGERGVMHRLLCGTSLVKVRELPGGTPHKSATGGIDVSTGNRYWTVTVSNMDAVAAACRAGGYKIPLGPLEFRPGVRIMMVEDPDGNWLELVQTTGEGSAKHDGLDLQKHSIDLGIMVEDGAASVAFFEDVLGFTPDPAMPELQMPDGSVMHRLYCGTSLIKIRQHAEPPPHTSARGGIEVSTGLRYWTVHVKNIDAMVARCQARGCAVPMPITEIRPGTRIAMVEDPDGNWVELLENANAPPAPPARL